MLRTHFLRYGTAKFPISNIPGKQIKSESMQQKNRLDKWKIPRAHKNCESYHDEKTRGVRWLSYWRIFAISWRQCFSSLSTDTLVLSSGLTSHKSVCCKGRFHPRYANLVCGEKENIAASLVNEKQPWNEGKQFGKVLPCGTSKWTFNKRKNSELNDRSQIQGQ